MKFLTIFLFLNILLLSLGVLGATNYVNISGNDITGTGTQANPWRTVNKGINASAAGDTIIIADGDYYEPPIAGNSLQVAKKLTFKGVSHGGARITMNATTVTYIFQILSDNVSVINLTLNGNGTSVTGGDFADYPIYNQQSKNNTVIRDNIITNGSLGCIHIDTVALNAISQNITIFNNTMISCRGNSVWLDGGGHKMLNISYNNISTGLNNADLGIAWQTSGLGSSSNGSDLYIGYNTFTRIGPAANTVTGIQGFSNFSIGFTDAKIEFNNFGDQFNYWNGLGIRVRNSLRFNITNNHLYVSNPTSRNLMYLELVNYNTTVAHNTFCDSVNYCNNSLSGTVILGEDADMADVYNNSGYFTNVGDMIWLYANTLNVTGTKIRYNNFTINESSGAHMYSLGEEANSSTETYYGRIEYNNLSMPVSNQGGEHSVFLGNCWYCNASFNKIEGGRYGLIAKISHSDKVYNNTFLNSSLLGIYDKYSNYTTYYNNTLKIYLSNATAIGVGQTLGVSTNATFINNTINISLTLNATIGFDNNGNSVNTTSNYNIYHLPYRGYNQTFFNGSYFNFTQWWISKGLELNSTFYPDVLSSDTTPPQVFNLSPPNGTLFNVLDLIPIISNITDDSSISFVYVNITYPNGTLQKLNLSLWLNNNYRNNFSSPNLTGQYNISWFANDTFNNINATERSYFILVSAPVPPTTVINAFNLVTKIDLFLWSSFITLALLLIILGLYRQNHAELIIAGFILMFLMSLFLITSNVEYKVGYSENSTYAYDSTNSSIQMQQNIKRDIYQSITSGSTLDHSLGYWLAIGSAFGLIGTIISIRRK